MDCRCDRAGRCVFRPLVLASRRLAATPGEDPSGTREETRLWRLQPLRGLRCAAAGRRAGPCTPDSLATRAEAAASAGLSVRWRQPVAGSGHATRRPALGELPAWRGTPLIDAARHLFADAAHQGGASRRLVIRASQTAHRFGEILGQPAGDPAPAVVQFFNGKVDPETGATSAAGLAGGHQRRPSSRYSIRAFCTCMRFSASSQTTD